MYIHPSTESCRLASAVLEECAFIHPSINPRRRAQLFIKNAYPSKEKSWTTSIHPRGKGCWVCIDLHGEARWRRLIG
jgi:hypothetical protein